MPFVNKNRDRRTHSTWLWFIRVNKTVRWAAPDRIDSATIPWFGKRRTIWERKR